jgi:hypothetical protein
MDNKCRQAIDEINAVLDKHKVGFEIYVDKDGEIMADIWGADHNQGIGLTLDSISLLEEFKGLITLMR